VLPNGVDNLLHVAFAGDAQLASPTMSFGQGSTRGTLTCDLEGATVVADLPTHVTTVVPHRANPTCGAARDGRRRGRERWRRDDRRRGAVPVRPAAPNAGDVRDDDNFLGVVDGTVEPLVDLDRTAQVIAILDAVWTTSD
jgi:hypothetical protein